MKAKGFQNMSRKDHIAKKCLLRNRYLRHVHSQVWTGELLERMTDAQALQLASSARRCRGLGKQRPSVGACPRYGLRRLREMRPTLYEMLHQDLGRRRGSCIHLSIVRPSNHDSVSRSNGKVESEATPGEANWNKRLAY